MIAKEVSRGSQSATRNATDIETFIVGLEAYEIAIEAIDHGSNILGRQGDVGHESSQVAVERAVGVGERKEREVSTNVVRGRVCACLVFEASGFDLVVVCWVAPTAEPGRRVVPDGRVVDVMSVCTEAVDYRGQLEKVHDADERPRYLWSNPSTAGHLCNRTFERECLQRIGHNTCAKGGKGRYSGSIDQINK